MKLLLTLLALMLLVSCETKVTESSDTVNVYDASQVNATTIYLGINDSTFTTDTSKKGYKVGYREAITVNTTVYPWTAKTKLNGKWRCVSNVKEYE